MSTFSSLGMRHKGQRWRGLRPLSIALGVWAAYLGVQVVELIHMSVAQGYYHVLLVMTGWGWSAVVAAAIWTWRHPDALLTGLRVFLLVWMFVARGLIGLVAVSALTVVLIG